MYDQMNHVPNCPYGFIYYVRPGDSIYSIAARFNVSVEALLNANPQITNPDILYIGQPMCIPYPYPPTCSNGFIYVVQPGDSIYSISRKFGVSIDAILAANPQIVDPGVIYPGQKICIPYPDVPDCPEGFIYTVEPGDTIYTIAAEFDVTPGEILAANPQITDPNLIYPGQQICIPEAPECDGTIYTVKSGDTLMKIANANDLTLDELLAANPQITNPNQIFVGQEICIPNSTFICDGEVYIVKAGDTMYKIAQRYNISLDDLIDANPQITDPAAINVGQKICIPV